MRLVSSKKIEGKRVETSSKLDVELIGNIKYEGDNIYSAEYEVSEIGNPVGFPFQAYDMKLYMKITVTDVYIGAHVSFADDSDWGEYLDYTEESDGIDFDIVLDSDEKIRLLTFLILHSEKLEK